MTFDVDCDLWMHENIKVPISINKVWFKLETFQNETIFTFSAYLTTWPQMTLYMKVPILYQKNKFGSNWTSAFQMRWILHFEPILQLDFWWNLTLVYDLWPHEHTKGPILYQIWFQSDLNLQLDLRWPSTLICGLWLHQQMRVPMLHLWPNIGWNHQSRAVYRACFWQ